MFGIPDNDIRREVPSRILVDPAASASEMRISRLTATTSSPNSLQKLPPSNTSPSTSAASSARTLTLLSQTANPSFTSLYIPEL
ncbi:hypothetical protein PQX77_015338 [Marasmius sp. AFHP31]|nr:hypothetical protein PQX77_015338 [Marasmius sp. AFHP31]